MFQVIPTYVSVFNDSSFDVVLLDLSISNWSFSLCSLLVFYAGGSYKCLPQNH